MAAKKKGRPQKKPDVKTDAAESPIIANSAAFDKAIKALAEELAGYDARMTGIREKKKALLEEFTEKYGMSEGPIKRAIKDSELEGAQRVTNVTHYLRAARALGLDIPVSDAALDKAVAKAAAAADAEAAEKAANAEPAARDDGGGEPANSESVA